MANPTPFGFALAIQREVTRQGQRTVEQGMDAQQVMTEAFVHNAIGMGRAANRNAIEATRRGMVTAAGVMDAMVPGGPNTAATIDEGFDSVAEAQENAWRVFERGVADGLAAYAHLGESGADVLSESVDVTLAAQRAMRPRPPDAAMEYERQRREDHATGGRGRPEAEPDVPPEAELVEPESMEPESVETDPTEVEPEEVGGTAAAAESDQSAAQPDESTTTEFDRGPLLEDISGVGSAYAEKLRSAGVESVEALLDADVTPLSEETEISDERLSNWQRQARHMLEAEE